MSFDYINRNPVSDEYLSLNENISPNKLIIKVNHNRKCELKNKFGIITPQLTDDFSINSFISNIKDKETKEISLTNENTIDKTSLNYITLDTKQLFTKKLMQDYHQIFVLSKPSLNVIESKQIVKDFSISKRFKEDKLILFSSIEERENEKKSVKIVEELPKLEKPESENDELEKLLKYQEKHLPVPLSKKDNEKYKILKMKQMKRISMPPNKSVRKFAEDMEPNYEKEFRIFNSFSTMKKRKPVHSTRRIYSSNYFLYKEKGISESFMVFRDKDIGIYEYWQAHIHESRNDEDIETDYEQKILAINFCVSEIKEGFDYIRNYGKDAFINFNRYSYLLNKKKVEVIIERIENNLEKLNLSKLTKKN